MTIQEIFSKPTPTEVIQELKSGRNCPMPDVDKAKKVLDHKRHNIYDKLLRPDKRIKVDDIDVVDADDRIVDDNGETTNMKVERVARVSLALQQLIINRAASFTFGSPEAYNATPENDNQTLILKALKRILYDAKSNSMNRKIARAIFGYKECAELWFPVEKSHVNYGFKSKYKLRCALFSPAFGDTLYPYFDEMGDMLAFSRSFSRNDKNGKLIDYFETYTDSQHWQWINGANGYNIAEGYPKAIAIGKIPIAYGYQDYFETENVDSLIDRLETLLSNFADTNDYHAAPKIFIKGELKGFSRKGESGAIIEGEDGSDAKYLAWQNAPESVKLEIESLLKMIYTITQTPDISFESVKGLGAISGIALKLLFMDAHLKVQDKREIFDDYLQRRVNVIKAYIGMCNSALESECEMMEIEPEITPYMLTNEIDELNYWLTANGSKPVVSQQESIERAGLSNNPEDTFEKIQEESTRENSFTIGEPVVA